jgi:hypothetical protein
MLQDSMRKSDHCNIMSQDQPGMQTRRSRSQSRGNKNKFLGRPLGQTSDWCEEEDTQESSNPANMDTANEQCTFEEKIVTAEFEAESRCRPAERVIPPWPNDVNGTAMSFLINQMGRMQDRLEALTIHQANQRLTNYPSTVSIGPGPITPPQKPPTITQQQFRQVEEAYKLDPRTTHELKVLRQILEEPDKAEEIVSKRVRYLAKAHLLGWRAAEDPPPLADVALLSQQETELLQTKKLEHVQRPPLPPAFQQSKPLTSTAIQIPPTDRNGKPIRNQAAYMAVMMKNTKK